MDLDKNNSMAQDNTFDPRKDIKRGGAYKEPEEGYSLAFHEEEVVWETHMDRVGIIRKGLPYESIEAISKRANFSVKEVLRSLGLPQTTYNKKKKDRDLLSGRDSEFILVLTELLDYGVAVFDSEKEKFQRWLKKPNLSLGGVTPESLFDSLTGMQEVKNALNRIEYGNLA